MRSPVLAASWPFWSRCGACGPPGGDRQVWGYRALAAPSEDELAGLREDNLPQACPHGPPSAVLRAGPLRLAHGLARGQGRQPAPTWCPAAGAFSVRYQAGRRPAPACRSRRLVSVDGPGSGLDPQAPRSPARLRAVRPVRLGISAPDEPGPPFPSAASHQPLDWRPFCRHRVCAIRDSSGAYPAALQPPGLPVRTAGAHEAADHRPARRTGGDLTRPRHGGLSCVRDAHRTLRTRTGSFGLCVPRRARIAMRGPAVGADTCQRGRNFRRGPAP
jgi:hypothetical protein